VETHAKDKRRKKRFKKRRNGKRNRPVFVVQQQTKGGIGRPSYQEGYPIILPYISTESAKIP